ncbi:hypothetical protein HGA92_01895 [Candidatus Gracilibacteria bacterium]|nr:hypothetical protein [Candidatus Gracilibacteria bacterium]NUJ99468.1 hypothetical protein [Candidatus Gracilibacteria bacterium]
MKNKKIFAFIFLFIFLSSCSITNIKDIAKKKEANQSGQLIETNITLSSIPKKKKVILYNFEVGMPIVGKFLLKGKVPTNWVFEGSFPIKILSSTGGIIYQGQGKANIFDTSGAVIEPSVEFESDIEIPSVLSQGIHIGKLILSADNPSALVENDDRVEVDILISQ